MILALRLRRIMSVPVFFCRSPPLSSFRSLERAAGVAALALFGLESSTSTANARRKVATGVENLVRAVADLEPLAGRSRPRPRVLLEAGFRRGWYRLDEVRSWRSTAALEVENRETTPVLRLSSCSRAHSLCGRPRTTGSACGSAGTCATVETCGAVAPSRGAARGASG